MSRIAIELKRVHPFRARYFMGAGHRFELQRKHIRRTLEREVS